MSDTSITPDTGTPVLTGVAPSLLYGQIITPPTQSLVGFAMKLSGVAPTVVSNIITPSTGTVRAIGVRPASNRYWVGGTAAWDGTAGTKWATTSGGAGGAAVPTVDDNVFFDGNSGSGTVTVQTGNVGCADLDFTGFIGTLAGVDQINPISGNLTVASGMTWSNFSFLTFTGTGNHLITTNGKTLSNHISVDSNGGSYTLMDSLTTTAGQLNLTRGTFNFNNQTVSAAFIRDGGTLTRTFNFGSSTITLTSAAPMDLAGTSGLTLNAGTSTITCTGGVGFTGGGKTFYNVIFSPTAAGTVGTVTGNNTFNNLTFTPTDSCAWVLNGGSTQTVTGTFTATAASPYQRILFTSNNAGTTQVINAAAVSLTDCDWQYITANGNAAPFTGTRLGWVAEYQRIWPIPQCPNIGFTTPVTKYWVGGTGNWSDATNHWATSSGGSAGANNYPLGQDDVVFDANSNTTAYTVTSSALTYASTIRCGSLNFSAPPSISGTITWAGTATTEISGNLTLLSGMSRTFTGAVYLVKPNGTVTITSNGVSLASIINIQPGLENTTKFTLADAFTTTNQNINLTTGHFDTGGFSVNANGFAASATTIPRYITLGASTVTLPGGWSVLSSVILSSGTSTIDLNGNFSTSFAGGGHQYYNVKYNAANNVTTTGRNIYNNFDIYYVSGPVGTTSFTFNADQTVRGNLTLSGSATEYWRRIFVQSDVVGTQRTFYVAGTASATSCDFKDIVIAGPGAPLTGTKIGDLANNSGITFTPGENRYWVGNAASWNGTNVWATSSGGAGATNNYPLGQDTCIFDSNSFSANGQAVTINNYARFGNVDFSAITKTGITWSMNFSNPEPMCVGNIVLDPNMSVTTSGILSMQAGSGTTQTVFSDGTTMGCVFTLRGPGSTVKLLDNMTSTLSVGAGYGVKIEAGTLDLNGKKLTTNSLWLGQQSTFVRGIVPNGGSIEMPSNSGTLLGATTLVNFSANYTPVTLTYSGGTGTRVFSVSNFSESNCFDVTLNAASDAVNFSTLNVRHFTINAFTGSWVAGISAVYGNLYVDAAATIWTGTVNFWATSGTQTITTNGKTWNGSFNFGTGTGTPTFKLMDNLTHRAIDTATHLCGTLDINGNTLTAGVFQSSTGNVREIKSTAAGGKIKSTTTGASTALNMASASGLTITRNSWEFEIAGDTTNTRTFNCGGSSGAGKLLPKLTFSNATANGVLNIFNSSNTFKAISIPNPPQTLQFGIGSTTTIEDDNGFPSGSAGNLTTITSFGAGNHNLVKAGGGRIQSKYLNISRSQATPSTATWYAGGSTDSGNNSGWIFTEAIEPTVGTLVLQGWLPTYPSIPIIPDSAVLALTGLAPSWIYTLTPDKGDLTVASGAVPPVPITGFIYVPTEGSLALTGIAPTRVTGFLYAPAAGSLTLAGVAPFNNFGILPSVGTLVLTGVASRWGITITTQEEPLSITAGYLPIVTKQNYATPSTVPLVLAGTVSVIINPRFITPDMGRLLANGSLVIVVRRKEMWHGVDDSQVPFWIPVERTDPG